MKVSTDFGLHEEDHNNPTAVDSSRPSRTFVRNPEEFTSYIHGTLLTSGPGADIFAVIAVMIKKDSFVLPHLFTYHSGLVNQDPEYLVGFIAYSAIGSFRSRNLLVKRGRRGATSTEFPSKRRS